VGIKPRMRGKSLLSYFLRPRGLCSGGLLVLPIYRVGGHDFVAVDAMGTRDCISRKAKKEAYHESSRGNRPTKGGRRHKWEMKHKLRSISFVISYK